MSPRSRSSARSRRDFALGVQRFRVVSFFFPHCVLMALASSGPRQEQPSRCHVAEYFHQSSACANLPVCFHSGTVVRCVRWWRVSRPKQNLILSLRLSGTSSLVRRRGRMAKAMCFARIKFCVFLCVHCGCGAVFARAVCFPVVAGAAFREPGPHDAAGLLTV